MRTDGGKDEKGDFFKDPFKISLYYWSFKVISHLEYTSF